MNYNDLLWWIFHGHHYWCMYMVTFVDPHQKSHFHKYRCCGDIQGLSRIMTIMMNIDRHHFISTTTIYGYGPLRVVTIDAYIWWHSLTVTISYFWWRSKNVTKAHWWWSKEPPSLKIDRRHSIWMSGHDGIEPPTSFLWSMCSSIELTPFKALDFEKLDLETS